MGDKPPLGAVKYSKFVSAQRQSGMNSGMLELFQCLPKINKSLIMTSQYSDNLGVIRFVYNVQLYIES